MFSCCIYRVDLYIPCPPRVSQPGWGTCCWWDQVFHGYTYGKWPRNDTHTKRFSDAWIDMTWPGWAMSTPYYLYSQIYIWIPATPTLTHHSYSLPHLPTCLGFLRLEHIRAYVYLHRENKTDFRNLLKVIRIRKNDYEQNVFLHSKHRQKKMVWLLKTNTIIKTKGESRIEILKLNSLSSRLWQR